jgi:hypothetical protein
LTHTFKPGDRVIVESDDPSAPWSVGVIADIGDRVPVWLDTPRGRLIGLFEPDQLELLTPSEYAKQNPTLDIAQGGV